MTDVQGKDGRHRPRRLFLGLVVYVIAYTQRELVTGWLGMFVEATSVLLVAESFIQHVFGKHLLGARCVLGAGRTKG